MEIKNVGYKPKLIYLKGKKPITIGPRSTIRVSEKDLESSSQLKELLARGDLRTKGTTAEKKAAAKEGKTGGTEEKSKSGK